MLKLIKYLINQYFIKYPHHIKYIKNPSLKLQLAVVNDNVWNIKYINIPAYETQILSVNINDDSIQFIKDPCLEVQLIAVNQNGHNIEFINNPCYEVQLAAIQEETNKLKEHFKYIREYITYPDLLELIEIKILACEW